MRMCAIEGRSQRPISPVLFCAMTEETKIEYVSVQFATLQGEKQMLSFPRGTTLGVFFLCKQMQEGREERE